MRKATFLAAVLLLSVFSGCSVWPKIVLDPESESFYETARLIMSAEEKDIFTHLPDAASRREFIEEFWVKRDPDPYSEENEFKKEFYDRIEYATRRFREGIPGWKTDRGRIYIFMGPPDKIEELYAPQNPELSHPTLVWFYYDFELSVEFVDDRNTGTYRIRQYTGDFFSAMNSLMLGRVPYEKGGKRAFVNFQLDYHAGRKTIEVRLPTEAFRFKDEDGVLRAEVEFVFFVYEQGRSKAERLEATRSFAAAAEDVRKTDHVVFTIPLELAPGKYRLDVVVIGRDRTLGKTRKIFDIKT